MAENSTSAKKVLQILWFAFLVATAMYWMVMQMIPANPQDVRAMGNVLMGVAGAEGAAVLYIRIARIGALLSRATPVSSEEVAKLRVLYIVCFSLSEAVALYGFVLHFIGASRAEVAPFFFAAAVLLLVCYPRLPPQHGSGSV